MQFVALESGLPGTAIGEDAQDIVARPAQFRDLFKRETGCLKFLREPNPFDSRVVVDVVPRGLSLGW